MSREIDFNRSLVELINDVRYGWRQNAVNLGGTTGSGGGHGAPPGGFIGQLPQIQVTGDTSELRTLNSGSIASLLDNLNRIRYWETVQIATSAPSPTFAGQIWIDGSSGSAINIRNEADTGWITFSTSGVTLDGSSPQDIASSAVVGTSGSAAHGDHVHRGVHSVSGYAGTFAYGDVVLVPGAGISINQSSGSFTINSANGTVLDSTSPVDVASSAVVGTSGSAAHGDHVHRGLHSLSAQGNAFIYGDAVIVAGSGVTLSQSSGSVTISAPAGGLTLDATSPVDVGSSAVVGTSGSASHGDHVHRGVHSVSKPGGSFSFGDVVLVAGSGVSVDQSSGSFTINAANGTVLDSTSPVDVGSSSVVGTSGSAAHGDHVHRGVHSVMKSGGTFAFGDIVLVAGTGISVEQSSGSFTINGANGTVLDNTSPVDVGSAAVVGTSGSAAHGDHVHRGLHAIYNPGNSFAFGDIALIAGSNVTITQSSGSFTIASTGGGGGGVSLDPSNPVDVGSAAVVGTSGSASHGDHVHRGVHSVSKYGGDFAFGDIVLVQGTGLSIEQSSGSFTINSANGTVLDATSPVDIAASAVVGTSGSAAHGDHTHRGLHAIYTPGNLFAYGDIALVAGSNITVTQSSGSFTITGTGGGGASLDSTSPVDVGSSAVVGTSGSAAHGDHVHRGVHSVSTPGGSFAYGDTVLVQGANITISQSSGSFTIAQSGGGGSTSGWNDVIATAYGLLYM